MHGLSDKNLAGNLLSTKMLFVSFWDMSLANLPEGTFRHWKLSPEQALMCIDQARKFGALCGVSNVDLLAPDHAQQRAHHDDLRRVLRKEFDIELAFKDFCSLGDDPAAYTITPLRSVEVQGEDRLLVINATYSVLEPTPENPISTSVDPDTISFSLFEEGRRVLGLSKGGIINVSEDFDEPLGDAFLPGEE